MRKRSLLMTVLVAGIAVVFAAGVLYAADIIKMENKAYKKHKQAVVEFHHKAHAEDYAQKYPDVYKNGCGECHHGADGKPLTALKTGDKVQGCIECHAQPGIKPSKEKLAKNEKIKKYHAEAIHENCKSCHKSYNKAKGLKSKDKGAAPTSCNKCHVK